MRAISGWCHGRPYVNEEKLSPQQYHDYFEQSCYTISFKTANIILYNRRTGYHEEVVPCDNLVDEAIEIILAQIRDDDCTGGLCGSIELSSASCVDRDPLCWKWEPTVTDEDGQKVDFDLLDAETKVYIASRMLEGCCSVQFEGYKEGEEE